MKKAKQSSITVIILGKTDSAWEIWLNLLSFNTTSYWFMYLEKQKQKHFLPISPGLFVFFFFHSRQLSFPLPCFRSLCFYCRLHLITSVMWWVGWDWDQNSVVCFHRLSFLTMLFSCTFLITFALAWVLHSCSICCSMCLPVGHSLSGGVTSSTVGYLLLLRLSFSFLSVFFLLF